MHQLRACERTAPISCLARPGNGSLTDERDGSTALGNGDDLALVARLAGLPPIRSTGSQLHPVRRLPPRCERGCPCPPVPAAIRKPTELSGHDLAQADCNAGLPLASGPSRTGLYRQPHELKDLSVRAVATCCPARRPVLLPRITQMAPDLDAHSADIRLFTHPCREFRRARPGHQDGPFPVECVTVDHVHRAI